MPNKETKEDTTVTKKSMVENIISQQIKMEYDTGSANNEQDNQDYEIALDMFDNVRTERDYDWQSNIPIPEFLNAIQGQTADDVSTYFSRKEFVAVNVMSTKPEDIAASYAAKDLIDKTLARTDLEWFQKYVALDQAKNIGGRNYVRCWWDQRVRKTKVPVPQTRILDVDIEGNPLTSPDQVPGEITDVIEQDVSEVIKDAFAFEPIDQRNIRYSSERKWNLRNKNWVDLGFETTLGDLEKEKELMGYFNLDQIKGVHLTGQTEIKEKTTDFDSRGAPKTDNDKTPVKNFMVIERWGRDYAKVVRRDEHDDPIEVDYGYDQEGKVLEGAELLPLIQAIAILDGEKSKEILIRYQLNPYIDARGNRYIPLARGLCYIHPSNDRGFGDDVGSRGLQKAINDTFNANNDNTLLGMLKIIKMSENADEDDMPLRIEPMAVWPAGTEVVEFQSNTVPAINQMNMLTSKFNETNARDSGVPVVSSAAATTVARAEKEVNVRSQYKGLVHENTLMANVYWMIIQMSNQFMLEETAVDMIGEENARAFNADLDFIYSPISEALETESSKGAKIDRLNTTLGYVINSQKPGAADVALDIIKQIMKLMGKEEEQITARLFDEAPDAGGAGGGGGAIPGQVSPAGSAVNDTGQAQPTGQASQIGSAL